MSSEFVDDINTATEADVDECYGSKYLSAADIGDKKIRTTIINVRKEMLQQQGGKPERPKLVAYFANLEKPMVLNTTNKNVLIEKLGKNPADWKGIDVGLFTVPTTFGGRPTRGLRLLVLSVPKKTVPAAKPKPVQKPAATEVPPWPEEEGDPGPEFTEAAE
jgi:hypothetical protein